MAVGAVPVGIVVDTATTPSLSTAPSLSVQRVRPPTPHTSSSSLPTLATLTSPSSHPPPFPSSQPLLESFTSTALTGNDLLSCFLPPPPRSLPLFPYGHPRERTTTQSVTHTHIPCLLELLPTSAHSFVLPVLHCCAGEYEYAELCGTGYWPSLTGSPLSAAACDATEASWNVTVTSGFLWVCLINTADLVAWIESPTYLPTSYCQSYADQPVVTGTYYQSRFQLSDPDKSLLAFNSNTAYSATFSGAISTWTSVTPSGGGGEGGEVDRGPAPHPPSRSGRS